MPLPANETEIKLALPEAAAARRLLRAAGFRVFRRRVFEANVVFDTPKLALRGSRRLLRIREAGGRATVTYKGPPLIAKHKTRQELELEISSPRTLTAILEQLGYRPAFRYEKYRTEYHQPGGAGIAMLDETPVGIYLEIEGSPRWIDRTARAMGFEEGDYITASYGRLYLEWCERRGRQPGNMVFPRRRGVLQRSRAR
jgi:adenylate cyclase class 2